MEDAPDAASAAVSNILSVVCPAADCVFGDTMGDVFDAVAEVALGACGALSIFSVSCIVSNTSVVITLGSCRVVGAVVNVVSITLGSCVRCCCLMPRVCGGVVVIVLVCNGAIARSRIFAI